MASGAMRQPNYRDLSDDRSVSFGAECYVCHAQYVSTPEPLATPLPVDGDPDPATAKAIEAQKYEAFAEFDAAFRSITIVCFRCGNPACPDCWDVDKQMCGACVAERGLIRSPHRGEPADGPLAAGLLRRAEPGQYSEIARPPWLKELLRAQSDPETAQRAHLTAPPPVGGATPQSVDLPNLDAVTYTRVPSIEQEHQGIEPVPTHKIDAVAQRPAPGPVTPDGLGGPEGEATSGMVVCPRCGTSNYDFVTQCSGCGLQLIQVCSRCDRLNPGHVENCQQCGAPLTQPMGWSGVHQLKPPDGQTNGQAKSRRRPTASPAPASTAWPPQRSPTPPMWPTGGPAEQHMAWPSPERELDRSDGPRRHLSPPPAIPQPEPGISTVLEAATVNPALVGEMVTARHPYEATGPTLQPVLGFDQHARREPRGLILAQTLAAIIERVFTIALLCCVFVIIGIITAAESSQSANNALAAYLHYDVKAHVDALLTLLHIHLQK